MKQSDGLLKNSANRQSFLKNGMIAVGAVTASTGSCSYSKLPFRPGAFMKHMASGNRLTFFMSGIFAIVYVASLAFFPNSAQAGDKNPSIVIAWNKAALQGVRDSTIGPPMVARALAIVHTCIYDAWAAYDEHAVSTQPSDQLKQPAYRRRIFNQNEAISFAAYRALVDLFPGDKATVFDPLMMSLGYDPANTSTDTSTPSGVGNVACAAVLQFRHNDGSNQLGNLTPSGVPYADYTGYKAVNPPTTVPVNPVTVVDVNHWQPLQSFNAAGIFTTQGFLGAQWFKVIPFGLTAADELRSQIAEAGPAQYGSEEFVKEAREVVWISGHLTDEQKMIAEFWADGPHTNSPPGHWNVFAQYVSAKYQFELDDDVKMFFALNNAVCDAGIVAWDAKRAFDSVRPATSITFLFQGQQILAWGGPFKGAVMMDGRYWIPYQESTFPTPPFPEFISGHSTFSAAAAEVLKLFTRSDDFGESATFAPGSSAFEPGFTPAEAVTLHWDTFVDAANQAGISRRYGGIHFKAGDLTGRAMGKIVGDINWQKATSLWNGKETNEQSEASARNEHQ
jgi:hypothetical protein